jgi:hypothetical protein
MLQMVSGAMSGMQEFESEWMQGNCSDLVMELGLCIGQSWFTASRLPVTHHRTWIDPRFVLRKSGGRS